MVWSHPSEHSEMNLTCDPWLFTGNIQGELSVILSVWFNKIHTTDVSVSSGETVVKGVKSHIKLKRFTVMNDYDPDLTLLAWGTEGGI